MASLLAGDIASFRVYKVAEYDALQEEKDIHEAEPIKEEPLPVEEKEQPTYTVRCTQCIAV
jgi:hypothetical protein